MLQVFFVHPGVTDTDYTGQICAMVSTPTPPVSVPAKSHIVQLVPLSLVFRKQTQSCEETEALA